MIEIAADALRVSHMASFAVGIGAAAFLELELMRRFRRNVHTEGLRLLQGGHELIRLSVYALWATGLALLILKVGILGNPFTAKLAVKLGVVSLLSANMVLIDRFLIPELNAFGDRRIAEIPSALLGKLGAVAGFSAGCWGAALLLGGVHRFREMALTDLLMIVVPLISVATVLGAIIARNRGRAGEDSAVNPILGE